LHPAPGDRFTQADDAALVVRGDFGGLRVLLLSDLGQNGQEQLLARTDNLSADVVIIGFPRRGEPLVDPLLEATSPQIVVIGEAPEPMSEQRIRKVRERLESHGVTVMDTRETGAVTISVQKGKYVVSLARPGSTSGRIEFPLPGRSAER
jgi:beta-lactamase superfamily II metal-dependent hydrolase